MGVAILLKGQYSKTYINLHLFIEPIVHDQAMGHSNPMRLHWMPCDVGIVAHIRVVKVGDTFLVVAVGKRLIKRGKRCHSCAC